MAGKPSPGLIRSIAVTTMGNIAPVVAGLVTAPVLAQSLGVDGRGELAAATAPLLLMMGAITFGVPESITYHVARGVGRIKSLVVRSSIVLLAAGVLATVLVILVSDQLSGGSPELAQLIRLAAFAITPGLLLGAARGVAAGHELWTLIAAERGLAALLRLVLIVGLALTGNLTALTGTIVIALTSVIGGIVYFVLLRKRPPRVSVYSDESPQLLRFGLGLWMGTLAGVLLSRLDQIVMVPLSGTFMLGIYAVAVTISEVVLVFNRAVRDVVFAAESAEGQLARLSQASRISTLVTTAGALGVCVLSIFVVPWLFGDDFSPAVPVIAILLLGIVLGNPGSVAGAGLSARGKPILRSVSLLVAASVNVLALFILVPLWGAIGAALATVIGNVVAGYANIIWLKVLYDMPVRDFVGVRRQDFADANDSVRRIIRRKLKNEPLSDANEE